MKEIIDYIATYLYIYYLKLKKYYKKIKKYVIKNQKIIGFIVILLLIILLIYFYFGNDTYNMIGGDGERRRGPKVEKLAKIFDPNLVNLGDIKQTKKPPSRQVFNLEEMRNGLKSTSSQNTLPSKPPPQLNTQTSSPNTLPSKPPSQSQQSISRNNNAPKKTTIDFSKVRGEKPPPPLTRGPPAKRIVIPPLEGIKPQLPPEDIPKKRLYKFQNPVSANNGKTVTIQDAATLEAHSKNFQNARNMFSQNAQNSQNGQNVKPKNPSRLSRSNSITSLPEGKPKGVITPEGSPSFKRPNFQKQTGSLTGRNPAIIPKDDAYTKNKNEYTQKRATNGKGSSKPDVNPFGSVRRSNPLFNETIGKTGTKGQNKAIGRGRGTKSRTPITKNTFEDPKQKASNAANFDSITAEIKGQNRQNRQSLNDGSLRETIKKLERQNLKDAFEPNNKSAQTSKPVQGQGQNRQNSQNMQNIRPEQTVQQGQTGQQGQKGQSTIRPEPGQQGQTRQPGQKGQSTIRPEPGQTGQPGQTGENKNLSKNLKTKLRREGKIETLNEQQKDLTKKQGKQLKKEEEDAKKRKEKRTTLKTFERSQDLQNEIAKVGKYSAEKFLRYILLPFGTLIGPSIMTTRKGIKDLEKFFEGL